MRRLVALEARRATPVVVQTTLLGAGAAIVLALVGWMTPVRAGWILIACCLGAPWSLPMSVLRDRLDGGLEFVQSLPLAPGRIAGARLLAAALFSLPVGAAAAATFWLSRRQEVGALPALHAAAAVFALATLGVALLAALGVAIGLRLEARVFANLVGLTFVAVIAFHHLTSRFAPGLVPAVLALARRPWMPTLVATTVPCLAAALGWLAFHLARTGIERFTPGRDRVTW